MCVHVQYAFACTYSTYVCEYKRSVLQCVAVCYCVAVCCSVLLCCSVLQCVVVLQCVDVCEYKRSVLQCVAVCCSVLQCVIVSQCVDVCEYKRSSLLQWDLIERNRPPRGGFLFTVFPHVPTSRAHILCS